MDSLRDTCYKVMQVKRLANTTRVNHANGAASLPARFSYFWRFS